MPPVLVACIQLDTQTDEAAAWQQAEGLCRRAASYGAKVLALPENAFYEGQPQERKQDIDGLWKPRLAALARELSVSLVTGTLREATPDTASPKSFNTLLAIDSQGEERGHYRKIHLFDIDLEGGPRHLESNYLSPGSEPVSCELPPLGIIGLSICYDLRFPELYRKLTRAGAQTLFVPSSFTMATGRDHWLSLLRARAIENQCFVVAPNQWGTKGSLAKYGRSAIFDPWGTMLACAPDGPSLCLAELDFESLARVRRGLPCMSHARLLD